MLNHLNPQPAFFAFWSSYLFKEWAQWALPIIYILEQFFSINMTAQEFSFCIESCDFQPQNIFEDLSSLSLAAIGQNPLTVYLVIRSMAVLWFRLLVRYTVCSRLPNRFQCWSSSDIFRQWYPIAFDDRPARFDNIEHSNQVNYLNYLKLKRAEVSEYAVTESVSMSVYGSIDWSVFAKCSFKLDSLEKSELI